MKAVQIIKKNKAIFVESEKPVARSGYALVRSRVLSLCGSDIHYLRYEPEHEYPFPVGSSGHEVIAVVEDLVQGEEYLCPVQKGQAALVIEPPQLAMAEYFLAEYKNIIPVPENVPYQELVQAQQLGTVIYACKRLPDLTDKTVAIVGQGSAGIWFDVMIKRMGAKKIIAVDLQKHRLELSQRYGATHTIHNLHTDPVQGILNINDGELADVVIEAAGAPASINLSLDLVKEYGFVLLFGVPYEEKFVFEYNTVFRKNLTLHGCVYASREPGHTSTKEALRMIAEGEVDVKPILTHRFPFSRVLDAYELQGSRDKGAVKIVIEMP
jgi:threonine dehydrogenase-like Zn-dependent dehydrogenase